MARQAGPDVWFRIPAKEPGLLDINTAARRYWVLNYLNTGILVIDCDYSVLFWNDYMQEWTGLSRMKAVSSDLRVLIPSVENDLFRRKIETIFNGKKETELSPGPRDEFIPVLTAEGKMLDCRVFLKGVPGIEGNGLNIIFEFMTDRSCRSLDNTSAAANMPVEENGACAMNRAQLEKELARRAGVEKKLAGYALDLEKTNRKLDLNRKELEELIFTASQDLKTPIVSIHGFSRLLKERLKDMLDDKSTDYLNRIMENATRMEMLLADILGLSRIGTEEIASEEIDMNELAGQVCSRMSLLAEERKVKFIRPGKLPPVFGKRKRILELLVNLVDNAVRYMPEREVACVEIGFTTSFTVSRMEGGAFYVKDNGKGIPNEFHDRIFRMFQKAPGDRNGKEGSGAGLTLAKKIVNLHGGEIWLESIPGQGTTFYFTLPPVATTEIFAGNAGEIETGGTKGTSVEKGS